MKTISDLLAENGKLRAELSATQMKLASIIPCQCVNTPHRPKTYEEKQADQDRFF